MVEPIEIQDSPKDELSIKEFVIGIHKWIEFILTKWIIILIIGLTGGLLGFFYANSKRIIYTAETTFVLEEGNNKSGVLGQLGGIAGLAGINMAQGGGIFQQENIIELYKSRSMIVRTLLSEVVIDGKNELLIERYLDFNGIRSSWKDDPKLANLKFDLKSESHNLRLRDSVLGDIAKTINSSYLTVNNPDRKLNIIKVEVKSHDEIFAKAFNDQIVSNVNDFYVQTKTKKALENLSVLQFQTDSIRNILNGAIYATAEVSDATPNLNPARQILRAPAERSRFNAEANKVILSQLLQNLELAKLSLRQETPLIQVINYPVYPLEKDRLSKVKAIVIGVFLFVGITVLFFSTGLILNRIISSDRI
ncbi:MAG: lipopolysaccharide biosynthesis protein [Daejeonella sp.]|nr:lipopolysaccharide biosynthesis protein [Daejeonella sp.]